MGFNSKRGGFCNFINIARFFYCLHRLHNLNVTYSCHQNWSLADFMSWIFEIRNFLVHAVNDLEIGLLFTFI
jgi:hypothetical protein